MDTKKLRQKILDLAIRGKLVPQDPNDEPASVLLERIRAEKERLIAEGKIKRSKKSATSDTPHYENVPNGWTVCTLEDIIDYEQPQAYIVQSTDFKSQYKTPVLTAGKSFIIGYTNETAGIFNNLPVIIFDDFTTDSKYVNFPFKVKSSAMKILHVKEDINIQYVSWFMSITRLIGDTHKRYWISEYSKLPIPIPPREEQNRIVSAIEQWFTLINILEDAKDDLQNLISQAKSKILDLAIRGKIVPQDPNDEPAIELLKRINSKFTPCDNAHYGNMPNGWTVCTLEDIIDYEQPQAYIVQSTDYKSQYKTPVLTAGKSFVIGYTNESEGVFMDLPVIIFDDFTTDSKFVDFPFKVKSSVIKILHVKEDINIQYVCWFMSITRLIGDTHKRYWISEYSKLPIPIPPKKEQDRIINKINELFQILDNISAEL